MASQTRIRYYANHLAKYILIASHFASIDLIYFP